MSETVQVQSYPLSWPTGWPRTAGYRRKVAAFAKHTLAAASAFVLDELRLLGARQPVISTNVALRQDGLPRSGQRQPSDSGVAVYFLLKGQPKVLACDRWMRVEDNLWAIGKHIESLRGQERWGVGTIDQAFMGYDALPAPASWWEVLGVDRFAAEDVLKAAYRQRALEKHPDSGGSHEEFVRLQTAWEAARKERGLS